MNLGRSSQLALSGYAKGFGAAPLWILFSAVAAAGCGGSPSTFAGPPPISLRSGALQIDVVYPREGSLVAAVDSNFIFGSIGNGAASLTINGEAVSVEPNGSFLAWLPVPQVVDDTLATYELVAGLEGRTVRHVHSVRVPRAQLMFPVDSAGIDSTSLSPTGLWWVTDEEEITVRVRGTPNARVRLLLPDGESVRLFELGEMSLGADSTGVDSHASATYEGVLTARSPLGRGRRSANPAAIPADRGRVAAWCQPDTEALVSTDSMSAEEEVAVAQPGRRCARVELALLGDTAWAPLPLELWILDGPAPYVELLEAPSGAGADRLVAGLAAPGGTVTWLWADGTRARVSGRRNDAIRLELDAVSEAWVALRDLVWLGRPAPSFLARVGAVRAEPKADRLEVRVPIDRPVPYDVAIDGRHMAISLYGATATSGTIGYGSVDGYLQLARWEQATSERYVLHLDLVKRPWGFRVLYNPDALVLEVRRPPPIDREHPLVGRSIAIDAGHPPGGSTGPTRLYEGDVNLAIAARVKRLLEEAGATVIMTRTDRAAVRLYDRVDLTEISEADVLVSIHNNALPDGTDPFSSHGTSVYYFHPHTIDFARAVQRSLLAALGLRDLGISRASLALARPIWTPAVLSEGAFMMIPAHEAGLRDPDFLEAYARGVVDGIQEFLRGRAE